MRFSVALLGLAGCATVAPVPGSGGPHLQPQTVTPEVWDAWPKESGFGAAAAGAGRSLIGVRSLKGVDQRVTDDCVGFVRHIYAQLNIELIDDGARGIKGGVPAIWDTLRRRGLVHFHLPAPGDLVFFTETYDRNHDGLRDDGLTHVGVVELVDETGGIWFVHRAGHGVERSRLDFFRRDVFTDPNGALVNDYLRNKDRSGPAKLTGELLYGFASVKP